MIIIQEHKKFTSENIKKIFEIIEECPKCGLFKENINELIDDYSEYNYKLLLFFIENTISIIIIFEVLYNYYEKINIITIQYYFAILFNKTFNESVVITCIDNFDENYKNFVLNNFISNNFISKMETIKKEGLLYEQNCCTEYISKKGFVKRNTQI